MINFRSANLYLVLFFLLLIVLDFVGILKLSWSEIFSYASMFWGISLFYQSALRELRNGIFIGSLLFQIGVLLFFDSKFELTEPNRIIIPAFLTIIGFSLLLIHLLSKKNNFGLIVSFLFVATGILLLVFRGNFYFPQFISSIPQILKEFWFFIIVFAVLIVFGIWEFTSEQKNQS